MKIFIISFLFLFSSKAFSACLNDNDCGIGYYCRLQNGMQAPKNNNIAEGLCIKKTDKSGQSGAVQGGSLRSGTSGLPVANPGSSENSTPSPGSSQTPNPPAGSTSIPPITNIPSNLNP